jgi:hypothetical protein
MEKIKDGEKLMKKWTLFVKNTDLSLGFKLLLKTAFR